ncbi:MAG: hypothetical protein WCT46_01170 [Candidatus Gracilibacteria bacterium]|jgi:hypothetical protein
MKKIILALFCLTFLTGCNPDAKFAVYLTDMNQMVFSEDDVASYDASNNTFTFTEEGLKNLEQFQSSKLDSYLYQKPFVVKIGDEEIYSGKFWSNFSSLSEDGIVMCDVAMLSVDFNTLYVSSGYPIGDSNDQINDTRITDRFEEINKLK